MDEECGFSVSIPKKSTKSRTIAGDFDLIDSLPWYQDYKETRDTLVYQLENLCSEQRNTVVQDVIQFISNYCYTSERIPVISLLSGFSLEDHNSIISLITKKIDENRKITCRMVNLNAARTSSLKTLIESVVHDFVNNISGHQSFDGEEDDDVLVAKSQCSLLRLADWYLNNYGSLDELNNTNNDDEITYLVIVIRNIGNFSKQILNDFIRTISPFRNRLPFIFLIGVPYALNTLEKRFTSEVYSKLAIYPFQSQPNVAFLDDVLEKVFLSKNSVFHIGPDVFKVLCNFYLNYNFSVKKFIEEVKLCVFEHYAQLPVCASFCCCPENNRISDRIDNLSDDDVALILDLPSMEKYNSKRKMNKKAVLTVSSPTVKDVLKKLYDEFNISIIRFNAAVRCLDLLMKSLKQNTKITPIREIFMHVWNTEKRQNWLDSNLIYISHSSKSSLLDALKKVENMLNDYQELELKAIRLALSKHIKQIEESQDKIIEKSSPISSIKAAKSPVKASRSPIKGAGSPIKAARSPIKVAKSPIKAAKSPIKATRSPIKGTKSPLKATLRSPLVTSNSPVVRSSPALARRALFTDSLKTSACKEKLHSEFEKARGDLFNFLKQEFFKLCLKSLDDIPLGELFIFNNRGVILSSLDPFPTTALRNALESPITYLECTCCKPSFNGETLKKMPDLSIVFRSHNECGNTINLYDWFQQFRCIVDKKNFTDDYINPEIYSRFIIAMKELQYLGYISLPRKKSNGVDYVTKLAYF